MVKKLNLGCGTAPLDGWINVDSADLPGADLVYNIEDLPLPFEDQEIDEILCRNILEHVEYIPILADLHRILKPDGILTITVPHFTSRDCFVDPTHKKLFSIRTFDFFVKDSRYERDYYFDFKFRRFEFRKLVFNKEFPFYLNYPLEWFFNLNLRLIDFYELTMLARLFPAQCIELRLVK